MKIGIYGVLTNSLDDQNIQIIKSLITSNYFEKVIIVPVNDDKGENKLSPFEERFVTLSKSFENDSKIEISKAEEKEYLCPFDVMNHLQIENPEDELFYIVDADFLNELDTWYKYEKLLAMYKVLIIKKDGIDCEGIVEEKYSRFASRISYAN